MTKAKDELRKIENTTGGGHVGGTTFGQQPDAKTRSDDDKKGDKARPNDGKN